MVFEWVRVTNLANTRRIAGLKFPVKPDTFGGCKGWVEIRDRRSPQK